MSNFTQQNHLYSIMSEQPIQVSQVKIEAKSKDLFALHNSK